MSEAAGGVPQGGLRGPAEPTSETKAPTEVVLDVVIIFLVGVAIVIGLLVATYLLMMVLDKYCCCIPGWRAVGEFAEVDHGIVARKAGLWGLRQEERKAILEKILVGKPYTADLIQSDNSDEDNPGSIIKNETEETTNEMKDEDVNPPDGETNEEEKGESKESEEEDDDEDEDEEIQDLDEANHDVTCAICLCEYVEDELVLSGTSCDHLFHKSCAFEWLSKNDHCPYCRSEMMTADEMRTTAEELLGENRCLEMRMWGPTRELMRNNFETDAAASPRSTLNSTTSAIEMVEPQSQHPSVTAVDVQSA